MDKQAKVFVATVRDLQEWLSKNHETKTSVWLVKWKKDTGKPYITYDEMVDELVSFGWIDSLPKNLDNQKTMHRISPRNPKSNWSKVNRERVERLFKRGQMRDAGIKLMEEAKKNGTWNFLDDVEELIIPPDLEAAFKTHNRAKFYYNRFPNSSKRNILEWIKQAKQASTRQKRIGETVKKAEQNIKANHPKGREAGPK
ncbi:MAG: YdeI/OmpD-associated family protein [Cyclobacteriaceae bacterium]|nr:YdeI/OmpD-associated family protein [Cyclobacteriaceae bacterium HetDA_MAG_MS6]